MYPSDTVKTLSTDMKQALELVDFDRFRYDYKRMRFFGQHN